MADYAFLTQFKDEYEAAFERRTSDLSLVVNTDVQTKGNQAVWDIVGSSGSAVTRGLNGYIPAATPDENQVSIFLKEWHALDRKTATTSSPRRAMVGRSCPTRWPPRWPARSMPTSPACWQARRTPASVARSPSR